MIRSLFLVLLVVAGIALLLAALVWQVVPGWASVPGGFLILFGLIWKDVLDALQKVLDLWRTWREEKEGGKPTPQPETPSVRADNADNVAVQAGPGTILQDVRGSIFHAGEGDINIDVQPPAPLQPGGTEPRLLVPEYVHRGIEEELMRRLRAGESAAVVGVVGYGGVGKTTTAQYVRDRLRDEGAFARSLWVYCGERDIEAVLEDYAAQCGLDSGRLTLSQAFAQLHAHLQDLSRTEGPLLVVLDDVREAHADHLSKLLPPRPCAALVTSRLRHLELPHRLSLNVMTPDQARRLLRAHLGEGALAAEPRATERLIELTRCHPLALDVAARRVRDHQDAGHATPLAWMVNLLEARGLDALDHHASVKAVLNVSYELLNEEERRAFRLLGALAPSGFAVEDAAAVWEVPEARARDLLRRLEHYSLVAPAPLPVERYRLHALLHELASDHLAAGGEADAACRRLAAHLIALFERHYTVDPSTAPQLLHAYDNLARAAAWAESRQEGETLARLATVARNWLYNVYRGWAAWERWLKSALDLGIGDDFLRANTLKAIGDVLQFRKDLDQALDHYQKALHLFRQVGDRLGQANTLQAIGDVLQFRKDLDQALDHYQKALHLFRQVGSRLGQANTLAALSRLALQAGRDEEAQRLLEQAVALHRAVGSTYDVATDYFNFALVLRNRGRPSEARDFFLRAAEGYARIGLESHAEEARRLAGSGGE